MSWRGANSQYIVKKLGLTSNLIYSIDPGDSDSYDGSGQTLYDLSGNGNDFQLGATSGSESSDPTFPGNAGRLSLNEYFALDGTQYLKIKTMPAEIETFHKDSALSTIAGWWFYQTGFSQALWCTKANGSSSVGLSIQSAAASDQLRYQGGASGLNLGLVAPTLNSWNFVAVSFDEAAGILHYRINKTKLSLTSITFSTPSASNSGSHFIASTRSPGLFMVNGSGIGLQWTWNRALSVQELSSLFDATRGRYQI